MGAGARPLGRQPETFEAGGIEGGGVEVDEADLVAPLPQGVGGTEAVGDVAAERGFLAQPGNVSHRKVAIVTER